MDIIALNWFDILLIAAATLFVSETVTQKTGPFGVFDALRTLVRTNGEKPTVLTCPWCLTPWAALALFGLYLIFPPAVWVLAISGISLMLRSYSGVRHG